MLLLSDREADGERLSRDLALIIPCTMVPVQRAGKQLAGARLIVCDIALDKPVAVGLLRAALERYRQPGIALLCLVREQNHHLMTQAKALGATEILPLDTPRALLLNRVAQLAGVSGDAIDTGAMTSRQIADEGALKAVAALAELMLAAETGSHVSLDTVDVAGAAILDALTRSDIKSWLSVVQTYDQVTYQHSLMVAGLAAFLSLKLGFNAADRQRLTQAALLHDIGKARVPLSILNKPARLTDEEMAIMRMHAPVGFDLLVAQGGFDPEFLSVVRHHHEYLDGSGYPDGLIGEEITDLVRLTTVCDIYAALIERRAYKPPMAPDKAFAIMWEMDAKLDADLLRAFQKLMAKAAA